MGTNKKSNGIVRGFFHGDSAGVEKKKKLTTKTNIMNTAPFWAA